MEYATLLKAQDYLSLFIKIIDVVPNVSVISQEKPLYAHVVNVKLEENQRTEFGEKNTKHLNS